MIETEITIDNETTEEEGAREEEETEIVMGTQEGGMTAAGTDRGARDRIRRVIERKRGVGIGGGTTMIEGEAGVREEEGLHEM
jgi:hypothetical protein